MRNIRFISLCLLLLLVGQEVNSINLKINERKSQGQKESPRITKHVVNREKRVVTKPGPPSGDEKKEKEEEEKVQKEANPQPVDKSKIRCPDGKVKKINTRKDCRIEGLDTKKEEWTYVEYLKSKNCPKFTPFLKKAVMYCFIDQNPCKDIDEEDVKEAFQLCQKEEAKKEEEAENPDAEQDEPEETRVGKNCKPLDVQVDEDFEFPLYSLPKFFKRGGRLHEGLEWTDTFSKKAEAKPLKTIGGNPKAPPMMRMHGSPRAVREVIGEGIDTKLTKGIWTGSMLGGHSYSNQAALFLGNENGNKFDFPEPKDSRYLTTVEFDAAEGGIVSFYLKDGPDDGDAICQSEYNIMKAEYERQQRAKGEYDAKDKCNDEPPCNGHGEGIFTSKCTDSKGDLPNEERDSFECHDKKTHKCTCKCEKGFKEPNCLSLAKPNTNGGFRRCRSVGDPHPNTAAGANFNLYDAGEFVWSRHPDVPIEARLRTRPAGRVAVNRGFSLKKCKGAPFPNGEINFSGNMNGPCETISMDRCSFYLETCEGKEANKCKCQKISNSFTSPIFKMKVTSHTMSVDGWSIQYSCGSYMDSYLTITSPRDGRSLGLCGYYGKNGAGGDTGNGNFLARSGSRGGHRMTSRAFYESPLTIKSGRNSHFRCNGFANAGKNTAYHFKRLGSTIGTHAELGMKMAEQMLTEQYARDKAWSLARMKDPAGNEVSTKEAGEICRKTIIKCSGMPVPDASAMTACVADYVKVGHEEGKSVLKGACDVVKEDDENTEEDIKEDEVEEKLKLKEGLPLKVPGKFDVVVQWCVKDCDKPATSACTAARKKVRDTKGKFTVKEANGKCAWKQMKAFPAKAYGDYFKCDQKLLAKIPSEKRKWCGWRPVTVGIPKEAIEAQIKAKGKMRIRFFQEHHKCYCCNVKGIDNIKITTGGLPIRCVADKEMEVFADGEELGYAAKNAIGYTWNDDFKTAYRFRAPCDTKVVGAKVKGSGSGRAGLMCSIGDSVVTSSSWRCTDEKKNLEGEGWDDKKFSTKKFDASTWPSAVELGRNQGEGTDPWGQIPSIPEKAFWIYTHDTFKQEETKAKCRIDLLNEAFQTYSKENPKASRWSCTSDDKDRQSPFSKALDQTSIKMAAVSVNEEDDSDTKAADSAGSSMIAYGGPGIAQWKNKPTGRIGYRLHGWHPDTRLQFASYAIDEKKKVYPKSTILVNIDVRKLVDKSTEGAMIKKAALRLYVTDSSTKPFYYCNSRYGMNVNNVNYKQFNITYFRYLNDCRIGYARKTDEFVALDITTWMRDWVNGYGSRNIAILFDGGAPGKTTKADAVGFATAKADIASQRPRLSISCHGDRVQPLVVFKEKKVELKHNNNQDRKNMHKLNHNQVENKIEKLHRIAAHVHNRKN